MFLVRCYLATFCVLGSDLPENAKLGEKQGINEQFPSKNAADQLNPKSDCDLADANGCDTATSALEARVHALQAEPGSIINDGDSGRWTPGGLFWKARVRALQAEPGSIINDGDSDLWAPGGFFGKVLRPSSFKPSGEQKYRQDDVWEGGKFTPGMGSDGNEIERGKFTPRMGSDGNEAMPHGKYTPGRKFGDEGSGEKMPRSPIPAGKERKLENKAQSSNNAHDLDSSHAVTSIL